jgi:hypothetical protein
MVLMNLANYAQFEREMISERTRDALRHLKSQGVRLGHAPYGHELSTERDAHGRRILVPLPDEQVVVLRMKLLRREGLSFAKIARRLNEEQIPARRNGTWRTSRICIILDREGMHTMRKNRPHIPSRFDPEAATATGAEAAGGRAQSESDRCATAEGETDSSARWEVASGAGGAATEVFCSA